MRLLRETTTRVIETSGGQQCDHDAEGRGAAVDYSHSQQQPLPMSTAMVSSSGARCPHTSNLSCLLACLPAFELRASIRTCHKPANHVQIAIPAPIWEAFETWFSTLSYASLLLLQRGAGESCSSWLRLRRLVSWFSGVIDGEQGCE